MPSKLPLQMTNLTLIVFIIGLFFVRCLSPDIRMVRKPFVNLCAYSHILGDSYVRDHQVVTCPEKIQRESEWFGLSGPVATLSADGFTLHFDKQGKLLRADALFSHKDGIQNYARENKTITFGNSKFQGKIDENGRLAEWTERCVENCRILQARPHPNGADRYISFPVGSMRSKTTYHYAPGELRIVTEEFDYVGASAERPGPSVRLLVEAYKLTNKNTLTLERIDRIGNIGSKKFVHKREWNLTPHKHKSTFYLPDPKFQGNDTPAELPVQVDDYGNWIKRGPGRGAAKAYEFTRTIEYW